MPVTVVLLATLIISGQALAAPGPDTTVEIIRLITGGIAESCPGHRDWQLDSDCRASQNDSPTPTTNRAVSEFHWATRRSQAVLVCRVGAGPVNQWQ